MENLNYETLDELQELIFSKLNISDNYEFEYSSIICDRIFENYQIIMKAKIYTKEEYQDIEELQLTLFFYKDYFTFKLENLFLNIPINEIEKFYIYDKDGNNFNIEYISTLITDHFNNIITYVLEMIFETMQENQEKGDSENQYNLDCLNAEYYRNCI